MRPTMFTGLASWCGARALFVMAFLILADTAMAGPWTRDAGGVFLSASTHFDRADGRRIGVYGEYGLRGPYMLGIEGGRSASGQADMLLWWQRSLDRGTGPDRWAISGGVGVIHRQGQTLPQGRLGLAWGRGLDSVPVLDRIPGGGWLAAEAGFTFVAALKDEAVMEALAVEGAGLLAYLTPETAVKGAVTLGLRPWDGVMVINQFRYERRKDAGSSRQWALSVVRDLAGPVKLELGVVRPLSGGGKTAVMIGTWIEF